MRPTQMRRNQKIDTLAEHLPGGVAEQFVCAVVPPPHATGDVDQDERLARPRRWPARVDSTCWETFDSRGEDRP